MGFNDQYSESNSLIPETLLYKEILEYVLFRFRDVKLIMVK